MTEMLLAFLLTLLLAGLGIIVHGLWRIATPTRGPRINRAGRPGRALLLIDLQEDFTQPANLRFAWPEDRREAVFAAIRDLAADATARNLPVLTIRQVTEGFSSRLVMLLLAGGAGSPGRPGLRLDSRLGVTATADFTKPAGDAFSNPALADWLDRHHIGELLVAGLDGVACVHRTIRGARRRGYAVTVLTDAVLTAYPEKWGRLVKAYPHEGIAVHAGARLP